METWVISLKSSTERRRLFDERMKGLIDYNYFEAFGPSDIQDFQHYFDQSDITKFSHWFHPEAVIACAKSHFHLWKKSIDGSRNIFIMEDDAQFINERAIEVFQQLKLPDEFDIFYLDGIIAEEPVRIVRPENCHLGHSYIVSPHGARTLVDEVERNGFKRAVDWQMFNMQPDLISAYELTVPIFRQIGGVSSITRFSAP